MGATGSKEFPYKIGNAVSQGPSVNPHPLWRLHDATHAQTGETFSVFCFPLNSTHGSISTSTSTSSSNSNSSSIGRGFSGSSSDGLEAANCARETLKRAKTLLHPSFLKFVAGEEVASQAIYIVTEHVTPLSVYLASCASSFAASTRASMVSAYWWGVSQVAAGLEFLHARNMAHHAVSLDAVYVTRAGDWKLFGTEFADDALVSFFSIFPRALLPPELSPPAPPPSFASTKHIDHQAIDIYGFGKLASSAWDILFPSQTYGLPAEAKKLFTVQMTSPSPAHRPPIATVVAQLSPLFRSFVYVQTRTLLSTFALLDAADRERVVENAVTNEPSMLTDEFPADGAKYAVIPAVLDALRTGVVQPVKTLDAVLSAARSLYTTAEYAAVVTPAIIDLFARSAAPAATSGQSSATLGVGMGANHNSSMLRLCLLNSVALYGDSLTAAALNDTVYPQFAASFNDIVPGVREAAVKACVYLVPRLRENVVSSGVLRALWKLQTDNEPAIRTNTVICIGKIAPHLSSESRAKVLVPAFQRALRDPFQACRQAAILATAACADLCGVDDCASKAIPMIAPFLAAPQSEVREAAYKCIQLLMQRIKAGFESPPAGEGRSMDSDATPKRPGIAAPGGESTKKDKLISWAAATLKTLSFGSAPLTNFPSTSTTVSSGSNGSANPSAGSITALPSRSGAVDSAPILTPTPASAPPPASTSALASAPFSTMSTASKNVMNSQRSGMSLSKSANSSANYDPWAPIAPVPKSAPAQSFAEDADDGWGSFEMAPPAPTQPPSFASSVYLASASNAPGTARKPSGGAARTNMPASVPAEDDWQDAIGSEWKMPVLPPAGNPASSGDLLSFTVELVTKPVALSSVPQDPMNLENRGDERSSASAPKLRAGKFGAVRKM
eukprot:ANDGO_04116.mRNA.1 putative inactive serine/threonine-protein kinase scy1